ncbi:unnamed protein product [Urochloa decumbens]|uniref:BHLH domain-containing protein n=1 Tax=Urochloa decumbens TaxID=240449 RepID=A0ABC9AL38_9POAL
MEDSSMFMQWAIDNLLNEDPEPPAVGDETTFPSLQALRDASRTVEMVRELVADEARAANTWSSGNGDITDGGGSSGGGNVPTAESVRRTPPPPSSTVVSWNFVTGSAQPASGMLEEAHRSPPARRTFRKSRRSSWPATTHTPDHIIAERKRREKINKRLIELATVIPGLKKMDKATILSNAAKYVKELQHRLKDLEEAAAAGSNASRIVEKPRNGGAGENNGSPTRPPIPKKPALPEIEARFSEKSAMVRVHCEGGKGVAATMLAEVEELGLSIVHANVMPFLASTMIITITAKVEEGFSVTAEEIVGTLNSALSHQHSSCNGTE